MTLCIPVRCSTTRGEQVHILVSHVTHLGCILLEVSKAACVAPERERKMSKLQNEDVCTKH